MTKERLVAFFVFIIRACLEEAVKCSGSLGLVGETISTKTCPAVINVLCTVLQALQDMDYIEDSPGTKEFVLVSQALFCANLTNSTWYNSYCTSLSF